MVRGTLDHTTLSLTLYKADKLTMDPQKASPKLMVPLHVKGGIIYEFRSASRRLVQQHSVLSSLPYTKHHYGWLQDG